MCAYHVTLAVGNAARHDTGRRIQLDVLAPAKSDAAVIAERLAELGLESTEYAYAKRVVVAGTPPWAPALALAA
jgi:hypothetical protein